MGSLTTHLILSGVGEFCRQSPRRPFLNPPGAGPAAVAAANPFSALAVSQAEKAAARKASSETLVATLFKSLKAEQRKAVCFPFDDPLRSKVDNNWMITDKKISEFFTKDQQAMIREIFIGLHSPDYAEKVLQQVEHDGGKEGFGGSSIALFGEPGTGKFEFVLAGRHVTRRCDGDSVEGAAFGGPIFYGHAAKRFNEAGDHPGNIYWDQARRANEVFKMLDGKQRELALLDEPREEKGTDSAATGTPGKAVRPVSLTGSAPFSSPGSASGGVSRGF